MKKLDIALKGTFKVSGLILVLAAITFLSSCTSEYHWVKVKSADPHFAAKSDNYAKANPVAVEDKSPSMATATNENSSNATDANSANSALATATDPSNSEMIERAQSKAKEIGSHLSAERKAALNSDNKEVRKTAISQTIHEELAKDAQFNKLPEAKKAMIEKVLVNKASTKMSSSAKRNPIAGINTLLLVGLILLLIGLILSLVPGIWIVGLIFVLVGLVLSILGLVEMLG